MDTEVQWIVAAVLEPKPDAGRITLGDIRSELAHGGFEVVLFAPGGFLVRELVEAATAAAAREAFFVDLGSEPVGTLLEVVAVSVRDAEQPLRGVAEHAMFRGFPPYGRTTPRSKHCRHRKYRRRVRPHLPPGTRSA